MTDEQNCDSAALAPRVTFAEFLESAPPSSSAEIPDLLVVQKTPGGAFARKVLATPEIQLHCGSEHCNGTRFFRCAGPYRHEISGRDLAPAFLRYVCSNCAKTSKMFALAVAPGGDHESGVCYKFGEMPAFGPPTPSGLVKLAGPDRELFLKGRRCENQGLGIGAFVYYRRVVEDQKHRILDEIIRVATKIGAPSEAIAELEAAKHETQFSKAIASIQESMPQSLFVRGHNPLALLYSALSDGLHDKSDEHCLEVATSVRVILADLAEKLHQALKDEKEVGDAVKTLLKSRDKRA